MQFRRRQPIGNRGLVVIGAVAGGITFVVLWGDGAEIGRAVLAGGAVAAWLIGFVLALNWSNRMRQQHITETVRQLNSQQDDPPAGGPGRGPAEESGPAEERDPDEHGGPGKDSDPGPGSPPRGT